MAGKKKADDAVMVEQTVEPVQFSKEQIVASNKFRSKRDLVTALLDESEMYTLEQVDELVNSYEKGKVK